MLVVGLVNCCVCLVDWTVDWCPYVVGGFASWCVGRLVCWVYSDWGLGWLVRWFAVCGLIGVLVATGVLFGKCVHQCLFS